MQDNPEHSRDDDLRRGAAAHSIAGSRPAASGAVTVKAAGGSNQAKLAIVTDAVGRAVARQVHASINKLDAAGATASSTEVDDDAQAGACRATIATACGSADSAAPDGRSVATPHGNAASATPYGSPTSTTSDGCSATSDAYGSPAFVQTSGKAMPAKCPSLRVTIASSFRRWSTPSGQT
jgi:hypothetical protein